MYTNAVQISDLVPETVVRILMSNGQFKYGFMLAGNEHDERTILVTGGNSRSSKEELAFEELDMRSIVSIDPFMK